MATNNVTPLSFKRGLLKNLPSTYENGTLYVTTDEKALYLDIDDTARIRLGDFQEYADWESIQAINPSELQSTALYYAKKENVLAKYDPASGWRQINPDSYVESVSMKADKGPSVTEGTSATIKTSITHGGGNTAVKTGTVNVIGKGITAVSADDSGNLVITTPDTNTDTKVTSADNHYDPKTVSADKQSNAEGEGSGFVTGIVTDGKGHIVKLTKSEQTTNAVSGVNVDVTGNSNTAVVSTLIKQSAGGDKSDNFTIAGGTNVTVTHANDIITIAAEDKETTLAGHYTPASNNDATINVTAKKIISQILKDTKGHVTGIEERNENDLASVENTVTNNTNEVKVGTKVTSTAGTVLSDTVSFVGAGSTTVSSSGKTVTITSAYVDEHTTEDGHYAPSSEDTSKKQEAANGKVISGIKLDSKNHVVGITTTDASKVNGVALDASKITKGAQATIKVETNLGDQSDTLDIVSGNDDTTVTTNASGQIVITSTDTKVTSVEGHYKPTGASAGTHAATGGTETTEKATTQVISGITTDAAGHLTGITSVGIKDTHANINEVVIANNATAGFDITVKDTDNVSKTATLDPTIKYGKNKDKIVKFVEGVAEIDTYAIEEIDKKIGEAISNTSAMVLVGEVNDTNGLPTIDFSAGDTYLVTKGGVYQGQYAEAGDLFVAKYDSTSTDHTGTIADWYYVSSGNDVTSLVGFTDNGQGFYLTEGDENTPTPGSKVVFAETTNIMPTVTVGASAVNVAFNMVWGEF